VVNSLMRRLVGEGILALVRLMRKPFALELFELKLTSPFPETDWGKLVPEPKGKVMVCYRRQQLPSTPSQ
jgi:sterol 14-demethylase